MGGDRGCFLSTEPQLDTEAPTEELELTQLGQANDTFSSDGH